MSRIVLSTDGPVKPTARRRPRGRRVAGTARVHYLLLQSRLSLGEEDWCEAKGCAGRDTSLPPAAAGGGDLGRPRLEGLRQVDDERVVLRPAPRGEGGGRRIPRKGRTLPQS